MSSYDLKLIGYITTFENLTGTRVKDSFNDRNENLVFIVDEKELGKAIGKNGGNIKRIGGLIKKRIRVIGYSDDVVKFVKNIVNPLKVYIKNIDGEVIIEGNDSQTRAHLIGRDRKGVDEISNIVKKYFNVVVKVK